MKDLDLLDDIDHYRRLFTSAAFWEPYVKEVCRRHNLAPGEPVRIGVPGTCPTFITAERWVIKFFGRLFEGGASFEIEREAGRLAAQDPKIHTACIIAQGELGGEGWPWPYIVYQFLPGSSLGEQAEQVSQEDWLRIAGELGEMVRRLHALPLQGSPVFPDHLEPYTRFLKTQRAACVSNHQTWSTLPVHLVEQIDDYLPPVETLVNRRRPAHLIHADLTRDHLLGQIINGHWQTHGLIDFGDAMTGDLLYELGALHMELFRGDQHLLQVFLDAYGLGGEERSKLPQKAMATALLHQFDLFSALPEDMLDAPTLLELENRIWGG